VFPQVKGSFVVSVSDRRLTAFGPSRVVHVWCTPKRVPHGFEAAGYAVARAFVADVGGRRFPLVPVRRTGVMVQSSFTPSAAA
jgi:hypothetical protein